MIAIYLHHPRPEFFDRARALADALGDEARLVSAHPPPLGWSADWSLLADSDPETLLVWLQAHTPATVIVDGPAAHARAVRTSGARLVVLASPGGGGHEESGNAYAEADVILAPWPGAAASAWPAAWRDRTVHVGALGWRSVQAARQAKQLYPAGRRSRALGQCLALWPTSAGPGPRERRSIAVGTPGWRWTYAPERELLEPGSVWSTLLRTEVAVCAPSTTTFAALAAFQVPAVLVLPERPTAAQAFLTSIAAATAPVVIVHQFPRPEEWVGLLAEARQLDGGAWEEWASETALSGLEERLVRGAATGSTDEVLLSV